MDLCNLFPIAGEPFSVAWPKGLIVLGFTGLVMSFAVAWYLVGWLLNRFKPDLKKSLPRSPLPNS